MFLKMNMEEIKIEYVFCKLIALLHSMKVCVVQFR